MVARRKIIEAPAPRPVSSGPEWEAMADPLHPMHRDLLRRFPPAEDAAVETGLGRPARFAFIFYAAILSWILFAAVGYVVYVIV